MSHPDTPKKRGGATKAVPGPKWTAKSRAQVHGARRPHPLDAPAPPMTRDEGWKRLLDVERATDAAFGPVRFKDAEAEGLYRPIAEGYARGLPPATLDPATERLRAEMLHTAQLALAPSPAEGLLPFWMGTHGLGFALDRCDESFPWSYTTGSGGRTLIGPTATATPTYRPGTRLGMFYLHSGFAMTTPLVPLRRLLFALPDDRFRVARAEALAWLSARRRSAPDQVIPLGDRVAFVLARDPTLAHELVDEALSRTTGPPRAHGLLLASITDKDRARRLVARFAYPLQEETAAVAFDVVETFGRDAAPLLEAILNDTTRGSRKLRPAYTGPLKAALKLSLTDARPPHGETVGTSTS